MQHAFEWLLYTKRYCDHIHTECKVMEAYFAKLQFITVHAGERKMKFNVTSKQDVKPDKEKEFQSLPKDWINVGINTSVNAENLRQSELKWRVNVYYLKSFKICRCFVIPWWLSEMILLWKDLLVQRKWNWPREDIGIQRLSVQSQHGSSKQNHCL